MLGCFNSPVTAIPSGRNCAFAGTVTQAEDVITRFVDYLRRLKQTSDLRRKILALHQSPWIGSLSFG